MNGDGAGDGDRYRRSVAYDVAKTAVERMPKAMAHELRPHGVAALAIQPGFTRTERGRTVLDEAANDDDPEEATDADADGDGGPGSDGPEAGDDDDDDRVTSRHAGVPVLGRSAVPSGTRSVGAGSVDDRAG